MHMTHCTNPFGISGFKTIRSCASHPPRRCPPPGLFSSVQARSSRTAASWVEAQYGLRHFDEDPTLVVNRCRSRLHTRHLSAHYLLPEHHELTALLLTLLLRQLIDQLIDLLLRELHHLLLEGLLFTLRALHVLSR